MIQTGTTLKMPASAGGPVAASPRTDPAGKPAGRSGGTWRYTRTDRPWLSITVSLLLSAALHTIVLYGFNQPRVKVKPVAVEEVEVVQIVMPELKEEEPERVEELGEAMDEAPAVAVPMLADAPSVTVSAFVQPLQYTPDVSADLRAAKVSQIPVNIARGGRSVESLGKIFEVSQLDRPPQPIAQPPPSFPFHLKQIYNRATVVVEFIVTETGDVVNATAAPSVHKDFEEAAVNGVSKWKFRPGMKAGKRVNTRVRVPLNFVVEES